MKIWKLLIFLTFLSALGSVRAFANCPIAPLSVYVAPGFTCTQDVFTFKSFVYQGPSGGLTSNQIIVTPIQTLDGIGFRFTGQFTAIFYFGTTYEIDYFVDPPPPIIRGEQIVLDAGMLQTTLCSTGDNPCPDFSILGILTATTVNPSATAIFGGGPVNMLGVQNMLTLAVNERSSGFDNLTLLTRPVISPASVAPAADGVYQLRYVANLNHGDSYVNLTNAGTLSGLDPGGRICINAYAFDPNEEFISCCSCLVTPNGLNSLSVQNDVLSRALTTSRPSSITIKLLSSTPVGGVCNPSTPSAANLAKGMLAWASTLHLNTAAIPPNTYQETVTPFSNAELSLSELQKLTGFCNFVQANGGHFGICNSCATGAQGAEQK